ncbi:MAG: dihydrofolate reductase family protein [Dehalococcoidia bacterium]|nr:dihydrofolate reductase family protein [Dehalococcoidia bacterium]
MGELTPLEPLFEGDTGSDLALPPALSRLYGPLRFPRTAKPHVVANFVSTLDGVVALEAGRAGVDISGGSAHDRMVMGLLRAVADIVVTSAGTLRSIPDHVWTAERIYPPLAEAYRDLRAALGKPEPPLNVIVTGSGELDPGARVLRGEAPALVLTTARGAEQLSKHSPLPRAVQIAAVTDSRVIGASAALEAALRARPAEFVLLEAGPQLTAHFLAERALDELFLTLAPQIAGRDGAERPGLVSGRTFAPDDARWATLMSARRGGSHLFLRYSFREDRG